MRSGWLVASSLCLLSLAACSAETPAPDAVETGAPDAMEKTDQTMVAVWHLPEADYPERGDRTIGVMVTQVACNSGTTNPVRAVDSASGKESISISVLVAPVEGAADCPVGEPRPYAVELGEPYRGDDHRALAPTVNRRSVDRSRPALCPRRQS